MRVRRFCKVKRFLFFIIFICFTISLTSQIGAETSLSDFYKIGTNDVLDIRVQDNDNLRTMATVTSDGTISFPYIGTIVVKGLSLSEIEKTITKKLSEGYIKYPVVTVSLLKALSNKFFSYGEVQRRGEIPLEEKITVIQALSMAGGVTQDGRFGILKVGRKQDKYKGVYKDLAEAVLNDGVIENNKVAEILLQPDDILIVEHNRTFLIQGEVTNRGRFVLEKDMTVLKGLLQAGGVTKDGLYGKVKVRRKQEGESSGYKDIAEANINDGVIESKEVENTLLQPDDILIFERNRTFLIQGEVANRGRFVLEKDMTVLNGLLQAGGVSIDGLYGKVKVRRKQEGESGGYKDIAETNINNGVIESKEVENTFLQPDDILIVERNRIFLIQGEVANRGRFILEKDMTLLKGLLQAGGVSADGLYGKVKVRRKQEGESGGYKDIAEANINDGAIESKEVENTLLEPEDILIVERNKTFLIYGEVNKTGEFVLKTNMTAFKALTIAGGFTKWGSEKGVKILRLRKDNMGFETIMVNINKVINGDAEADILLHPNDVVVVSTGIF